MTWIACRFVGHVGARFALSGLYVCARCHRLIVLPWAGRPIAHAAGVSGVGNDPAVPTTPPPTPAAVERKVG